MEANVETGSERRRSVLAALRRFPRTLILAVALGAAAGIQISQLQPVRYETSAEVLLTDPREAGVFRELAPAGNPTRYVQNQAQRFRSSSVALRTAELLDGAIEPAEVRERVSTETSQDLDLVVVRTWASTGEDAAQLANALVAAYEEVALEELQANAAASAVELADAAADLEARIAQAEAALAAAPASVSLESERDALVAQLVTLQGLQERLAVDLALYGSGVETIEPASVPEEPVSPRPVVNAVIGGLLALLAAGWFAVWKSESARRVEDRHDPAAVLQAPFLGDVPEVPAGQMEREGLGLAGLDAPAAESYRFIATALSYVLNGQEATTILVTSPHPGDGKTTTSLNVAVALRGGGRRLAVVDVDARMAGLTERTGLEGQPGLSDAARPGTDPASAVHALEVTGGRSIDVTPIGTAGVDPTVYFRTPAYRDLLAHLRASHEVILLDAPPLLSVAETSAAAGAVDGIVLVVSRGTPVKALEDVRDRLHFVGAPLLGYVFNRARLRSSGYGRYGYGRYGEAPLPAGSELPDDTGGATAWSTAASPADQRPTPDAPSRTR